MKWIFQLREDIPKKNTGRLELKGNFPMTAGNSRVMSAWTDVHMLITADLID